MTVLIVDDEPAICWGFKSLLTEEGYEVVTAGSAEHGLELAELHRPNLIVLDVRLPGMDGLAAISKFREIMSEVPVVVITAFGDLKTAVTAVREGATDYLTKPFRVEEAWTVLHRAMVRSQARVEASTASKRVANRSALDGTLVGSSPAMQQLYRQIAMVADSELSVLITGETGTGKELIAKAIHAHSRRSQGPYVPVAPVALNPTLIESELFGHVRGAFTGASEDRRGLFAQADGGTLLLDEIGDLPIGAQVKLLRVLEQREYFRVGEAKPTKCDARLIAATNADLRRKVGAGEFRSDLLFRLAAVEIKAPALRERIEDIVPLAIHFLQIAGVKQAESKLTEAAIADLKARKWWGNVRELRNVIEHAAVVSRGQAIYPEHLPEPIQQDIIGGGLGNASQVEGIGAAADTELPRLIRKWAEQTVVESESNLTERFMAIAEPELLRAALEKTRGNRAAAADLMGIHRGTLRERLRRYGLDSLPGDMG